MCSFDCISAEFPRKRVLGEDVVDIEKPWVATYRQDCNVDVVDDIDCLRDKIKSSMIDRLHLRHYPRIDSNIPMSNASSSLSPLHIQGNPGILMYQIRGGGVDAPGSIQPLNDLHLIVCLRV